MKPSVGRIVHYVDHVQKVCRAAIITEVQGDKVRLHVFLPGGELSPDRVPEDPGKGGYSWHWPERVDG